MNSIIDDDVRVTEQAAEWLGALLSASGRRADFFAWLAESPRHVEEFLGVLADAQDIATLDSEQRARIEQLAGELGRDASAASNVVPVSQRALAFYDGAPGPSVAREASRRAHRPRVYALLAAVFLVMLGAGWWFAGPGRWQAYATKVGEQRVFTLADGSTVHLNTDSKIQVHLTGNARAIQLVRGEALFSVAHDASRPFRVRAGDAFIQAVGTQFDVYRRAGSTRVAVIEGRVRISGSLAPAPVSSRPAAETASPVHAPASTRSTEPQVLSAGEAADVSTEGTVRHRQIVDSAKALSWRQRRLVFESHTLGDIAAEFNRYNARVKIRVEGSAATDQHFSGTFDADAPEALMQILEGDRTLVVERVGSEVVIRAR